KWWRGSWPWRPGRFRGRKSLFNDSRERVVRLHLRNPGQREIKRHRMVVPFRVRLRGIRSSVATATTTIETLDTSAIRNRCIHADDARSRRDNDRIAGQAQGEIFPPGCPEASEATGVRWYFVGS